MQWEYKLVTISVGSTTGELELNELGAQGFHLIATIQPYGSQPGRIILERGVNPEWDKVAAEFGQKTAVKQNPTFDEIRADWEG